MRSRQKIIDATLRLIETGGFGAASIAAVAASAGVSRQTVYSIFGSREQLVSDAVADLTRTVFDEVTTAIASADGVVAEIVAMLIAARRVIREHAVLTVLAGTSDLNPLFDEGMVHRARPVVREMLAPIRDRHPEVAENWDDIADAALAIGLFVVLFEDPERPDDDVAGFLTRWLTPAVESHTASGF